MVPELEGENELAIVPPEPVRLRMFTVPLTDSEVAVTAPLKLAVPPMFDSVSAFTPVTVVPVRSAPAAGVPVCSVRLLPLPVTAPRVRSPAVVVAFVESVVTLPTETAPRLSAVLVVLIVPLTVVVEGAVAVRPPVNVLDPPTWPSVSAPVFAKVVAPPTVLVAPRSRIFCDVAETLSAPAAAETLLLTSIVLPVAPPSVRVFAPVMMPPVTLSVSAATVSMLAAPPSVTPPDWVEVPEPRRVEAAFSVTALEFVALVSSRTAPVTPMLAVLAMVPAPESSRVPALTVVAPLYVLALLSVSLPAPVFVSPPELLMTPLMAVLPAPCTVSKLVPLSTVVAIVSPVPVLEPTSAAPLISTPPPPEIWPTPAVLPIVPVEIVTAFVMLAPPLIFSVFAPTAIVPVPAPALLVRFTVPAEIVVPVS